MASTARIITVLVDLIIIALYATVTVFVIVNAPIQSSLVETEQKYEIVSPVSFTEKTPILFTSPDIVIALTLYYNQSIIVGQPIRIDAVIILHTHSALNTVRQVSLTVQNALAWPYSVDEDGIPQAATMNLPRNDSTIRGLNGMMMVFFPVSGTYYPIYARFNREPANESIGEIDNNHPVQVLPHEQLAQQEAVHQSLVLTYAMFFLTLPGIVAAVADLLRLRAPKD